MVAVGGSVIDWIHPTFVPTWGARLDSAAQGGLALHV
jgi:hypothetical protein